MAGRLIPSDIVARLRQGDDQPFRHDPVEVAAAGVQAGITTTLWAPVGGQALVGLGEGRVSRRSGAGRLRALHDEVSRWPGPAFVGFGFADAPPAPPWGGFAAAAARMPLVLGDGSRLHLSPGASPADGAALLAALTPVEQREAQPSWRPDPPPGAWKQAVAEAVRMAVSGTVDKVVLARALVGAPAPDAATTLLRLARSAGGTNLFVWSQDDAVLLGASPELLVSVEDGAMRSVPLAGTAEQPEGLADPKMQREHGLMVDELRTRLQPVVADLEVVGPAPVVAGGVAHLATTFSARTEAGVLELAQTMHPSGAVGGVPREKAVACIGELEAIERGWYGGGIGLVAPSGDGRVAVAIRCGLIRRDGVWLYAGNGIVAGSDPAAELAETELKLAPMRDACGG